ncbi:MAG: glycosyltransferase family 1 protein [Gemmatimonadales bacterium]|nr:MAG: glycosyltransferase family 1 protein [Gemmatimonadales bacterium]
MRFYVKPGAHRGDDSPAGGGSSMSGRRVLLLNWLDRENPKAGGAEVHLHETFGRLARRGWEITLLSSGWPGAVPEATLDGIRVRRVGSRLSYPVPAVREARRLLATGSWDLVIEDLNKVPLFTPRWTRTPLLLLVHHLFGTTAFQEASLPVALPTWLLEKPIGRIYRGVPGVAVSVSTRDDLVQRGLRAQDLRVIPNGIDLSSFEPAGPQGRFPEPTLLYLGRLKRYKRVDLILQALRILQARNMRARLLVAGKGDHRPKLEREAHRLGLAPDRVQFLGFVSEEEKARLLARTWIHCLTSPKEGWGISNLEAAASGTPTVASDSPGLRDSVVHGQTGFLVPHGDVDALATRIGEILADTQERERMGREGLRFAATFSWDRTAAEMEDAMQETVAPTSRRT